MIYILTYILCVVDVSRKNTRYRNVKSQTSGFDKMVNSVTEIN